MSLSAWEGKGQKEKRTERKRKVMKKLLAILANYEEQLQLLVQDIQSKIAPSLPGAVNVHYGKNGQPQYYYHHKDPETGVSRREYIKVADLAMVQNLTQQDYLRKADHLVQRRLKKVQALKKDLETKDLDQIFESTPPAKQVLIQPVQATRDQRIEEWTKRPYQGKAFAEDMREIYTHRHERVRSKSEKILADTFAAYHLPYKYECPLMLNDGFTIYPDFTFLDPDTNEEIYWEHFGMMDHADYARTTANKIMHYIKNGILPGNQLILTFETGDQPLNDQIIERLIHDYLL